MRKQMEIELSPPALSNYYESCLGMNTCRCHFHDHSNSLSRNIFPQQNSTAGIHISRDALLEINCVHDMWTYVPTKSLNAFRKLVLEVHDSEVAPVIMRVDKQLHVAGVHNIID